MTSRLFFYIIGVFVTYGCLAVSALFIFVLYKPWSMEESHPSEDPTLALLAGLSIAAGGASSIIALNALAKRFRKAEETTT